MNREEVQALLNEIDASIARSMELLKRGQAILEHLEQPATQEQQEYETRMQNIEAAWRLTR